MKQFEITLWVYELTVSIFLKINIKNWKETVMKQISETLFTWNMNIFLFTKATSLKFHQILFTNHSNYSFPREQTTVQYTPLKSFVSKGFDIFQQRISRSLSCKNFLVDSTTKGRKESSRIKKQPWWENETCPGNEEGKRGGWFSCVNEWENGTQRVISRLSPRKEEEGGESRSRVKLDVDVVQSMLGGHKELAVRGRKNKQRVRARCMEKIHVHIPVDGVGTSVIFCLRGRTDEGSMRVHEW